MSVRRPFSFWLASRVRELLSPYTGSRGLKRNPAHSVLFSSSYHYRHTLPAEGGGKHPKALAVKSLLNFSTVRLFLLISGRKLKERKINKFLQLNTHTKHYSSQQTADNPNPKVHTNPATPPQPDNHQYPYTFIHVSALRIGRGERARRAALKHLHGLLCGAGEAAAVVDLREMVGRWGRCGCKQKSLATAVWEPTAADCGGKGRMEESTTLVSLLLA